MAMFNFFGEGEHRVFNYKPMYYDKDEEERKRKFGAVDGSMEKEKAEGNYVPGSYIRGSMREGAASEMRSHMSKVHKAIGIVSLLLIAIVLFFIAKFYSLL